MKGALPTLRIWRLVINVDPACAICAHLVQTTYHTVAEDWF